MAVAVLIMVAGTEGLNYTTNGWECTPEAIARSSSCKTECEGFTALVTNQEESESDSDSDEKKRCKIAAKTVMEIMDAMMMGLPSPADSDKIAAMRPMNDVALNTKIKSLFSYEGTDASHCYIDLESRWRTRDLECTDRKDKAQMLGVALLRLVDDMLPHYHKHHVDGTNDDQDHKSRSATSQTQTKLPLHE